MHDGFVRTCRYFCLQGLQDEEVEYILPSSQMVGSYCSERIASSSLLVDVQLCMCKCMCTQLFPSLGGGVPSLEVRPQFPELGIFAFESQPAARASAYLIDSHSLKIVSTIIQFKTHQ